MHESLIALASASIVAVVTTVFGPLVVRSFDQRRDRERDEEAKIDQFYKERVTQLEKEVSTLQQRVDDQRQELDRCYRQIAALSQRMDRNGG